MNSNSTENIQAEYQEKNQPPALGLNDLSGILTIIEVCSSRGAFKAEELSVIGGLYNKIQAFVKSHENKQAQTTIGKEDD